MSGFAWVPLEPPDSIPGGTQVIGGFDSELFDLCRDDDYRGLYRALVARVAKANPTPEHALWEPGPNGGPAFPVIYPPRRDGSQLVAAGMTLRDYFAAHATVDEVDVHTLAVDLMHMPGNGVQPVTDVHMADAEAIIRYRKADAMLKARQS